MNRYGYVALILISTFFFGLIGVSTRILTEDYGMNDNDVAFVRLSITVIVLLTIMLMFKREYLKIKMKDLWVFIIFGIFKFGSDVALFFAQEHIPLAFASLLQLTSPYFVMFFSLFFFKESITIKKIIAVIFAVFGCILATGVMSKEMNIMELGIVAGLVSGICYALYFIGSQVSSEKGYHPVTSVFYIFLFALLFSVPLGNPDIGHILNMATQPEPLICMLSLGIVMTLVPYFLIMVAINNIGSTTTSIVSLSEIIFSGMMGYLIFGEELNAMNIIGIILVIISIIIINLKLDRTEKMKAIDERLNIAVIDGELPSKIFRKLTFRKNKE